MSMGEDFDIGRKKGQEPCVLYTPSATLIVSWDQLSVQGADTGPPGRIQEEKLHLVVPRGSSGVAYL
jgi:hypothetical protein